MHFAGEVQGDVNTHEEVTKDLAGETQITVRLLGMEACDIPITSGQSKVN